MASSHLPRSLRPRFFMPILALLLTTAALDNQAATAQPPAHVASIVDPADVTPAVYIVQLMDAPLASYVGNLPGLQATSPKASGSARLDLQSAASLRYLRYLQRQRTTALAPIGALLGAAAQPLRTFELAFNGMTLTLTPAQAKRIARLPQVVALTRQQFFQQTSDIGPTLIGALTGSDPASARAALAKAILDGSQAVPATTSSASGHGTFVYNATTKQLAYQLSFSGLTPTAAQIALGAAGASGATQFELGAPLGQAYIGQIRLDARQETALYAHNLYVNIRTAAQPAGEIRGQISPDLGEDTLIGIIDSGINAKHPSFQDPGQDGYDYPIYPQRFGVCDPANASYSMYTPPFPCNDKLVGAWSFTTLTEDISPLGEYSPYDDDGHGSHVASTAGGNIVINPTLSSGLFVPRISGVAPHAHIIVYDASNAGSFANDALLAAIEQATKDGVQVLNMSLGGPAFDPWANALPVAMLGARDAGVMVLLAAGNAGPTAATVSSPSNAPWLLSVAASTHGRSFSHARLADLSGGSSAAPAPGTSYSLSLGTGATPLPIVLAETIDPANALCATAFAPNSASGKIVVCDRDDNMVAERGDNVAAGGAAGVIVVALDPNLDMFEAAFSLPAVSLDIVDGDALQSWLAAGSNHKGRIIGSQAQYTAADADIVAGFSSRGPNALVPGVLKPDVTAPGQAIFAAIANTSAADAEYGILSGTSMATPHTTGAAVLLRSLHPDWTPGQVQSALMTTALTLAMANSDADPLAATPFDQGAGRIDLARAALAGLVLDETAAHFTAANPALDGDPSTLNLPSLVSDACYGVCTWTRTVKSTLATSVTWAASTHGSAALMLSVSPSSFTLQPGAQQTITVTATVAPAAAADSYLFGAVQLTAADNLAPHAALPVALRPGKSNQPQRFGIYTLAATGSRSIRQLRTLATSSLSANVLGFAKGSTLDQTIAPAATQLTPLTVPANTLRLVAETTGSTALDMDLFVYRDQNGDGIPQQDEQICSGETVSVFEYCSLDNPVAGDYLVVVSNFVGSGAAVDSVILVTALVPSGGGAGALTATVPATVAPSSPFDATLAFNLPILKRGDRWYGVLTLNSGSGAAALVYGRTDVDLMVEPYSMINLPLVRR